MRSLLPPRPALLFVAVCAVALLARVPGLGFGLPYLWHPDEPAVFNRALWMVQTANPNPERFNYPSLYLYIQGIGQILGYLRLMGEGAFAPISSIDTGLETGFHHTVGSPELWKNGRLVTAIMGALACGFTYLAGRRLSGDLCGVLAALALALSPHHVENSRYITVDAPTSTAVAAALLACAYLLREGERRHFVAAAITCGIVAAFKYNAALVLALPLLAWALLPPDTRDRRLWWGLAIVPIAGLSFLACVPYALLDMGRALKDIAAEVNHYKVLGHGAATVEPGAEHLGLMLRSLVTYALPGWALLTVVGAVWGLRRDPRATVLLLAFPVLFVAYMAGTRVFFSRNLAHVDPPLALLAGMGGAWLWEAIAARWPARRVALGVVAAVLFLAPGAWTLKEGLELERHEDSRVLLARWMREEGPEKLVLAVPYELRLVESTLEGIEIVPVSMVTETPADWIAKGATHVVGAKTFTLMQDSRPDLTLEQIEPAASWFRARDPVHATGWSPWLLDTVTIDPWVAVYDLQAPPRIRTPASEIPQLAEELDRPATWELQPARFFGRMVRWGSGITIVNHRRGDPPALLCGPRVDATHEVRVLGWWRRERLLKTAGFGSRLSVRFFDEAGKLLPATTPSNAGIQVIATEDRENSPWDEVDTWMVVPPGGKKARVCVEVDADHGEVWVDDLRIAEAT